MSVPDVSILMPLALPAPYLAEAIGSCYGQSLTDWELVVATDFDGKHEVRRVGEMHGDWRANIRVVAGSRHLSWPEGENAALARASGRFITHLDADDTMAPEKLALQVAWLREHPECDIVSSGRTDMSADGSQTTRSPSGPMVPERFLRGTGRGPSPQTMMARRETYQRVGRYDEHFPMASDSEWTLRALLAGCAFGHVDEPLYHYRRHPGQMSLLGKEAVGEQWRRALRQHAAQIEEFLAACKSERAADGG